MLALLVRFEEPKPVVVILPTVILATFKFASLIMLAAFVVTLAVVGFTGVPADALSMFAASGPTDQVRESKL